MSDLKGLVLTSTILNDNDVLLNVLSEDGKVAIKAKGVLKPNSKNRIYTEIGCYSLFHTLDQNKKGYTLKNAESIQRFSNITTDLEKQSILQCLLEGFNKEEYELYEAIQFIEILNTCKNPYCLYAFYLCDLMKKSGIEIDVDECVICNSNKNIFALSIHDGGFVCKDCFNANHQHLSVQELKNIRYCMHASIQDYFKLEENSDITFETCKHLFACLEKYGSILLKSHAFLERIQPLG